MLNALTWSMSAQTAMLILQVAWHVREPKSRESSEVDTKHTREEPNGSTLLWAVATVNGERHDHRNCTQCTITDALQMQSWVQTVGTSGSASAGRTTDVTQVIRGWRWRWCDGSIVDTIKINLALCPFSKGRAIPLPPNQPARTCLIQRCARRAPSAISVVETESFHDRTRVRDATSSI